MQAHNSVFEERAKFPKDDALWLNKSNLSASPQLSLSHTYRRMAFNLFMPFTWKVCNLFETTLRNLIRINKIQYELWPKTIRILHAATELMLWSVNRSLLAIDFNRETIHASRRVQSMLWKYSCAKHRKETVASCCLLSKSASRWQNSRVRSLFSTVMCSARGALLKV